VKRLPRASLRTRLLLVIFGGAILPLALLGLWLAGGAERSGAVLLAERLDSSLQRAAEELAPRWIALRSGALDVAESPALHHALAAADAPAGAPLSAAGRDWLLTRTGEAAWQLAPAARPAEPPALAVRVRVPLYDPADGRRLGTLELPAPADALIPPLAGGAAGAVVGAFDPATRASLLPLPFDPERMQAGRFTWEGEAWLARFRLLEEPPLVLAMAAPLSPYTRPFAQAARQGALALLAVGLLAFLGLAVVTRRMTRSLDALAGAAGAVARGQLDRRVDESARDEFGDVARAFNAMTAELQRTLDQLARQQGLVSVGEFAASLAHEVRNPLSAIRISLQSLEEEVADARQRARIEGMLRQVRRLEATVAGSLRVARGGRIPAEPLALRAPLEAAAESARPEFAARGGTLEPLDAALPDVRLHGDAAALEQLFLNLLLNAAQALAPGGRARIEVEQAAESVEVRIRDGGAGIDPARLPGLFEPLSTTRPEGTGLGLMIARRIAHAHGGDLELESAPDAGTTVRVRLPALPSPSRDFVTR
jgi:signal transduction histidine kinase